MYTQLIHRTYQMNADPGIAARTIHVVASTDALDSYGERVMQDWDLRRFKATPTVLWSHGKFGGFLGGASAEEMLPIGRATDIAVRKGRLEATIQFVDEKANPMAERVWQGVKQGSINAVSVGFRTSRAVEGKSPGGGVCTELHGNELYELSLVPIPANPEATIIMRQKRLSAEMRDSLIRDGVIPVSRYVPPEPEPEPVEQPGAIASRMVLRSLGLYMPGPMAPAPEPEQREETASYRLYAAAMRRDDDGGPGEAA